MSKYIPINTPLNELLDYHTPPELAKRLEAAIEDLKESQLEVGDELDKAYKDNELLEEGETMRDEMLDLIRFACTENGTKRELVKNITAVFEESSWEG